MPGTDLPYTFCPSIVITGNSQTCPHLEDKIYGQRCLEVYRYSSSHNKIVLNNYELRQISSKIFTVKIVDRCIPSFPHKHTSANIWNLINKQGGWSISGHSRFMWTLEEVFVLEYNKDEKDLWKCESIYYGSLQP